MVMIASGLHHSIGVTKSGECLVWDRLDGGQSALDVQTLIQQHLETVLMDDLGKPRCVLAPNVLPITQYRYVAAGPDHCIAVTTEGKPYAWGFNATFQCGQPDDENDIKIATMMASKAIQDVNAVWADAGGQYSLVATDIKDTDQKKDEALLGCDHVWFQHSQRQH